jgi:hypothetical protein
MEERTYHDIVEVVPWQFLSLGDHGGSNQWRKNGSKAVESMQESENFVRVCHVSDPSVPCCISQAIAKSSEHEDDHENWIWRMHCDHNVRD